MNEIGQRIRALRESKRISQETMADIFGVTQSNYRRLELNDCRLKIYHLLEITKKLDTTLNYLVYGNPIGLFYVNNVLLRKTTKFACITK